MVNPPRSGDRGQARGRASYPAPDTSAPQQLALALPAQLVLALPAQDMRAAAQARLQALWELARPQLERKQLERKQLGQGQLGRRLLPAPKLDFYRGRTDAGRAHQRDQRIEINLDLLERHPDAMLAETIAHELAHLLVFRLFGRRARAHGAEWQAVMREWFGVEPQRTHNFDLQGLQVRRQQRHLYHCGCREHPLSTVRHRRAMRGVDYRCVACQGRLQPLAPPAGASTCADEPPPQTEQR